MSKIVVLILVVTSWTFMLTSEAAADTVCVTARLGSGLGAARIDFTLAVDVQGTFLELLGEARFSQPVSPPGNLIVYAVTGVAIPNTDGVWVSLGGTGYDVARTLYRGAFAAQVSADPSTNTFSYTRQNLDGTGAVTSTSTLPITPCP